MDFLFPSILFIVGLFLLIKGAAFLIDGASSLAKRFGISSLVIGLTIVSFGTSTPELIINIFASVSGSTGIAVGNILGSNIANIFLVLGAAALVAPLTVTNGTVWKEIPFSLLAIIILALMANDVILEGKQVSELSFIDGWALLGFFSVFLAYVLAISKNGVPYENPFIKQFTISKSVVLCIAGIIGLSVGGKFLVENAIELAGLLHISEAFIGLTIIAIGTSLPELVTSIIAVRKGNVDIALGNVVGSNVFNIFWILGISAVLRPIPFSTTFNFDIFVALGATLFLFAVMFVGKRKTLERWQGFMFLCLYIVYMVFITIRG